MFVPSARAHSVSTIHSKSRILALALPAGLGSRDVEAGRLRPDTNSCTAVVTVLGRDIPSVDEIKMQRQKRAHCLVACREYRRARLKDVGVGCGVAPHRWSRKRLSLVKAGCGRPRSTPLASTVGTTAGMGGFYPVHAIPMDASLGAWRRTGR